MLGKNMFKLWFSNIFETITCFKASLKMLYWLNKWWFSREKAMLQRPFCSINYSSSTSVCIYFEYWRHSNSIVHFQMIRYSRSKKKPRETCLPIFFYRVMLHCTDVLGQLLWIEFLRILFHKQLLILR